MRIWAKTMLNEKISQSIIFENDLHLTAENFDNTVVSICYEMDLPTPIILKYYTNNYFNFNICKFSKDDFVDYVNFDTLILEDATI